MHIFVVHAIKRASKEKSLQHHFIITGRRFTANNHRQKHRKYSKKCISSASAASRLPSTETVFYDQFFSFYFKRINLAQCLKKLLLLLLGCLHVLHDTSMVSVHAQTIRNILSSAVEDRKRLVRREAAKAFAVWSN